MRSNSHDVTRFPQLSTLDLDVVTGGDLRWRDVLVGAGAGAVTMAPVGAAFGSSLGPAGTLAGLAGGAAIGLVMGATTGLCWPVSPERQ